MYDYLNDAAYARDRYNEQIRAAEEHGYRPSYQPEQSNMLDQLRAKLASQAEIIIQKQLKHANGEWT